MINKNQFISYILIPALRIIDENAASTAALNLMLGTAATESNFGEYIKQVHGPACGIFQMEPATYTDITQRYLKVNRILRDRILSKLEIVEFPSAQSLIWDMRLAAVMARLRYWMVPDPLPKAHDIFDLGKYYKKHYNTDKGKGSADKFVEDYKKYIGPQHGSH